MAVDGAYALYPNGEARSSTLEEFALADACREHDLHYSIFHPAQTWQGGEVEKRAYMFKHALEWRRVTPLEDWFLIIDGDMTMDDGANIPRIRETLAATPHDVAENTFAELVHGTGDALTNVMRFRSLFRAIPGLTVEGTHWLYVVPRDNGTRRFMWHSVSGNISPEPAADLTGELCLLHRPVTRERERIRSRQKYYEAREQHVAERVPVYPDA